MQNSEAMALSAALLSAAGELTQRIHEGVLARGFEGLRPAHGFAFARLSRGGATATDLAAHLGVTKQAASQLVDELVRKGYAEQPAPPGRRPRSARRHDRTRLGVRAGRGGVRRRRGAAVGRAAR